MNWKKPFRDLATILYDDLDFKAMSLPRVGAALLTLAVVCCFLVWSVTDRMFPGYTELVGLCGGIWGAYVFKRRGNPPEEGGEKAETKTRTGAKRSAETRTKPQTETEREKEDGNYVEQSYELGRFGGLRGGGNGYERGELTD